MPSSGKPGSPHITLLLRTPQLLPNSFRVPADLMYWPLRSQGSGIISILTPHWPPAVPTSFLGLPVPAASTHELCTQAVWSEMHSPSCHPCPSCWLTSCLPSSLLIFIEMSPSEWPSPDQATQNYNSCFGAASSHFLFYLVPQHIFLSDVVLFSCSCHYFLPHHLEHDSHERGLFWASQTALVVKNLPANAGDIGNSRLISGPGRFPGGGHDNPFQYSGLENSMDRGAWHATVQGSHRIGHDWSDLACIT